MPSILWGSIFLFLMLELVVTFVLAIPIPLKFRNIMARKVFTIHLGDRISKPIFYIGIALALALLESFWTHRRLMGRSMVDDSYGGSSYHSESVVFHPHDKERKYKAERNMYLAGFSLTLLFVIGRIITLMQESVELEEETERVRKFVDASKKASTSSSQEAVGDKKND